MDVQGNGGQLTVNLAARLEGANKEYGSQIMISEDVMANLGEGFLLRRLDRLVVKGKKQPVEVFEVVGRHESTAGTEPKIRAFHAALAFYDRRDFSAAETAFARLSAVDPVAAMYADRCRHYLSEPPPSDWNGAFAMKTK